jgi:hypothetical protein
MSGAERIMRKAEKRLYEENSERAMLKRRKRKSAAWKSASAVIETGVAWRLSGVLSKKKRRKRYEIILGNGEELGVQ